MGDIKMTKQTEKTPLAEVPTEIVAQEKQLVNFNAETLLSEAIKNNVSVDTVERLVALAKDMQAVFAKQQFVKAMADFQAECPIIQKTKSVPTQTGALAYKYAPIESIVSQVKELLKKHGFSYSTTMEVLSDGVKACVKVVHIAGHSEESCMQVPLGTQTKIMSASQQTAAAQTFAKRYAFCNAFGILTGDEDNDGANLEVKEQISEAKTYTPKTQATTKQKAFIQKLCNEKGITGNQLKELVITYNSPSALIEHLLTLTNKQELPVVSVETPVENVENTNEIDVSKIPF